MKPERNTILPGVILVVCLGALWCVAHLILDADSAVHRAVVHGQ